MIADVEGAQSEAIFAALSAPVITDIVGNLYCLRPDGATVCVARASEQVGYLQPCTRGTHPWLASNRNIYCLVDRRRPYLIPLPDHLPRHGTLAQFAPVFQIASRPGMPEKIGFSASDRIHCIELSSLGATEYDLGNGLCLGGWSTVDATFAAGSTGRMPLPAEAGYRRGESLIVRRTNAESKVERLPNTDVDAALLDRLRDSYPVTGATALRVESWLAAARSDALGVHVVGGAFDAGLLEDEWMRPAYPCDTDFPIVSVVRFEAEHPKLVTAAYPYRFKKLVAAGSNLLVFLAEWRRGSTDSVSTLGALEITPSSPAGQLHSMIVRGADETLPVSLLDVHWDKAIGFYGCLSLRRRLYDHVSYLIRSDDGVNWEAIHELRPVT